MLPVIGTIATRQAKSTCKTMEAITQLLNCPQQKPDLVQLDSSI
eukprot:CAMPEP_0202459872 /NCGR_PEP_ID=MMETSP1360-20130828/39592_1 /ASSEMBLY_ACC=CAM_ASM_000848 /TAXON_ID=515479 /ORGANISM="Licmophora paradoxa, Strain CCMP2313" /LENGTH=43 /DNA_ID= /DNA_START= /DNA_END= /DNA_ORIENTATION=